MNGALHKHVHLIQYLRYYRVRLKTQIILGHMYVATVTVRFTGETKENNQ